MNRWTRFLIPASILLILACFTGCENETDKDNSPPRINRAYAVPDTVLPSGTVTLIVDAEDPDAGTPNAEHDSLRILWSSEHGNFPAAQNQAQVLWQAPGTVGRYGIEVQVSDGAESVTDSVFVVVATQVSSPQYLAIMLDPRTNDYYTTNDTILFSGKIIGVANFENFSVQVQWHSDIDGLLNDSEPDTTGLVLFRRQLSAGVHRITMHATIDRQYTSSDTATITVYDVDPLLLYPIIRGYSTNTIEWRHEADEDLFQAFSIRRRGEQGDFSEIARYVDGSVRTHVDTSVVLGQEYYYHVVAEYSLGMRIESVQRGIETGVFTSYASQLTGMFYDEPREYLFIALPDQNVAYEIDITANNVDYFYAFNDTLPGEEYSILFTPVSFALNENDRTLYVASSGDSAIWRIPLDSGFFTRLIDLRPYGMKPLYLDYDPDGDVLYGTGNNRFPIYIPAPDAWTPDIPVQRISDSRLIVNNSSLLVDEANRLLYISEMGNYPASLWKYDIAGATPNLLLEDVHGSLGYLLRDMDFVPDRTRLLLAGDSPHHVQIIRTSDFSLDAILDSGPSPTAITMGADNSTVYVGSGSSNEVQIWDLPTRTRLETIPFAHPIARDGIRVSEDGSILMVAAEVTPSLTRVFILYR